MKTYGIERIQKLLPHRYPMLLVDKVIDSDEGERIVAIKNVTVNEPFFQGHFPDNPIMPGVLQIEAIAQTGALLILDTTPVDSKIIAVLSSVQRAKFRRLIRPGDTLRIEVRLVYKKSSIVKVAGKIFVDNQLASEAEVMCMMVNADHK